MQVKIMFSTQDTGYPVLLHEGKVLYTDKPVPKKVFDKKINGVSDCYVFPTSQLRDACISALNKSSEEFNQSTFDAANWDYINQSINFNRVIATLKAYGLNIEPYDLKD